MDSISGGVEFWMYLGKDTNHQHTHHYHNLQ